MRCSDASSPLDHRIATFGGRIKLNVEDRWVNVVDYVVVLKTHQTLYDGSLDERALNIGRGRVFFIVRGDSRT